MAKRKAQPAEETAPVPPAAEGAATAAPRAAEGPPQAAQTQETPQKAGEGTAADARAEAAPQGRVAAPPQGEGRSYTIDNRAGYRKEDSADGRRRQIRFADREGGQRPDDELLAPVRVEKPMLSYAAREKAWQGRKTPDALDALDRADQELRDIGRKRGGPGR
jgi:hypothetical protein